MSNFTSKFAALVCTVLLSAACVTAAVGPAQAGSPVLADTTRVA